MQLFGRYTCVYTHTHTHTVELQSSETSNIRTHIFFVLRSNNEKSAITSRNKVLCHFYKVLYFVCTVLHCNGNIILEKPLDFMHCVASRFGYPNYRWSQLVWIIDVLLYYNVINTLNFSLFSNKVWSLPTHKWHDALTLFPSPSPFFLKK